MRERYYPLRRRQTCPLVLSTIYVLSVILAVQATSASNIGGNSLSLRRPHPFSHSSRAIVHAPSAKGSADDSPPTNKTAPSYAYAVSLVSANEGPVPGYPEDDVAVVENGSLVGPFANCSAAETTKSGCFFADTYADRTLFRISFVQNSTAGRAHLVDFLPRVISTGGRSNPKIVGLDVDGVEPFALFTVKYMCSTPSDPSAPSNATSSIKLTVPVGPSKSATLTWNKVCGSGRLDSLTFGYRDHDDRIVPFNEDGTHGADKDVALEVSPHDLTTVLTLSLKSPVESVDFLSPFVTTGAPKKAAFAVRSALMGGTVWARDDRATEISIMYECKEAVRAEFTVTIGIPPWTNLTATWTKDCVGHIPRSLLIGTAVSKTFDVMQDGELSPAYNISDQTTALDARLKKVHVFGMDVHSVQFYISNIDETSEIHIQSVTLTLSPSDTMVGVIENPRMAPVIGTGNIGKSGTVLGRKEMKRLELHFYCRKGGTVLVLVTLATLLFQNVEFGFIKECVPGGMHRHHALTAGSLMSGIFLAFVATSILAGCYLIRKRRRDAEKQAAAVSRGRKVRGKYTLVDQDEGLDF